MARILITDDTETIREMMKAILTEAGHTIVGEATNGREAIEKFKELRPDITTLDIAMPLVDGMEALDEIIEIDPKAKILMVSSVDQGDNIPMSIVTGACEFIKKPFDKETLIKIVSRIDNLKFPT